MRLLTLEHGPWAYRADFAFYGAAVAVLAAVLAALAPQAQGLALVAWSAAGLLVWTLVEYLLHRFVLHGLQPFRRWHAAHHDRPTALICAPTLLSAGLILVLVFLPVLWLAGAWPACASTWGLLMGYLAYAVTHHATHHWRADNAWTRRRKHWHAAHHHLATPVCFGVTSGFWDVVFGSLPPDRGLSASSRAPSTPRGPRARAASATPRRRSAPAS
jgi:cyclopropane-fatty-acyl-phospholipid synthase